MGVENDRVALVDKGRDNGKGKERCKARKRGGGWTLGRGRLRDTNERTAQCAKRAI